MTRWALVLLLGCSHGEGAPATFIAKLDDISAARSALANGTAPQQLNLSVFVTKDGRVSADPRPELHGAFALEGGDDVLRLRGSLGEGCTVLIDVRIERGGIAIDLARTAPAAACAEAARSVASLWGLTAGGGAARAVHFDGSVLGTALVRQEMPALFTRPGEGTWLLLKSTSPEGLFLALDARTGAAVLYPKTAEVPDAAGTALWRALATP